jgi:ABC-type glycerol-3-phosphate transport system substrate-binding protein
MNRRHLLKAGILGAGALFGACAGGGDSDSAAGDAVIPDIGATAVPAATGAPVTIGLVSTGLEGPRLAIQIQQIIQDMHSRGIASSLTHTLLSPRAQGGPPAMADAIEAALNDGRSLDVLYISNPELLIGLDELDLLMPVDEVSRSDSEFDFADYFPAAVQAVTLGGRAIGLPLWMRPMTVRVNLEAFDEAGVDVPSGSWDWQSFAETAARLTVRSGDQVDRYGFVVSPADTPAFSFMWQNGADILLQNSSQAGITRPAAIEAVQFMSDLVHVHGVAPVLRAGENAESLTPSFRSDGIFVGGTPVAMAPYAFGKSLGMQVNTTRSQRGNQVEVTVDVIMTADESGNPVVGSSGDGSGTANLPTQKAASNLARPGGALVVLSTSQSPEDAWAAVRQLEEELEPMGTVPARRLTAAQLMEIDTTLKPEEAESVIAAAAVARVPVLPHRDEVLTILQDEVDEPVLRGESEPEPALEGAANAIEKLLAG